MKRKRFLTNKNIAIKPENELLTDNSKLTHLFNTLYTTIVESISGKAWKYESTESMGNLEWKSLDHITVSKFVESNKCVGWEST